MKTITAILTLFIPLFAFSQQNTIEGDVIDSEGKPLQFATVALLNPADSTLSYFGITNSEGRFEITKVHSGNYLMQTAFLGYKTFFKNIDIPLTDGENFGSIILQPNSLRIAEVQVKG